MAENKKQKNKKEKSKKEPYIDKHQLGERILKLSLQEGKKDTAIAAILTAEGHKLSQPTVSRWLKARREEMGSNVKGIMQEHLEKKLPGDLNALEEMELITLEWIREERPALVERLLDPAWCADACVRWKTAIEESKPDNIHSVMKGIVRETLNRVTDFFNIRREKLNFIKSTREDIALKLQYAGIIEGAEKGNIIIMTSKKGESPQGPQGQQGSGGKPKLTMVLSGQRSEVRGQKSEKS